MITIQITFYTITDEKSREFHFAAKFAYMIKTTKKVYPRKFFLPRFLICAFMLTIKVQNALKVKVDFKYFLFIREKSMLSQAVSS